MVEGHMDVIALGQRRVRGGGRAARHRADRGAARLLWRLSPRRSCASTATRPGSKRGVRAAAAGPAPARPGPLAGLRHLARRARTRRSDPRRRAAPRSRRCWRARRSWSTRSGGTSATPSRCARPRTGRGLRRRLMDHVGSDPGPGRARAISPRIDRAVQRASPCRSKREFVPPSDGARKGAAAPAAAAPTTAGCAGSAAGRAAPS